MCTDEEEEAKFILGKIQELRKYGHPDVEGQLEYDDFAIIARNRYALTYIEKVFNENSIPYFYKKTVNGIESESDYMKIFDLALRVFSNKHDIIHIRELCTLLGCNIPDVNEDILQGLLKDSNHLGILKSLQYMSEENFDFNKGLKEIENTISHAEIISNENEKYLIYNDIELWRSNWKKYTSMVARENRTLISFRNYIALGKTQDVSSDIGVALLTAHMSKGLQYEVVFVIGLTEGTFPDYRAVSSGGKELEQEKNNMFVAATRAKRICYFTYPRYKKMPWGDLKIQSKSRFLEGVQVEVI